MCLDSRRLLHYNISHPQAPRVVAAGSAMSVTRHSHGDAPHEPATVSLSILRLSVWERLAAVAALIALLWVAVHWAT